METTSTDIPLRRRKRRRKIAGLVLAMVLLLLGALVFWASDRDIVLPDWARDQIASRLQSAVPGTDIAFGEVVLVVDEGWRPRVRVRNIRATSPEGYEIVAFSEVRASLSLRGMMKGQLELQSVDVSGVFLTLRRGPNGISLSGGGGQASTRQAPNLAQLVADLDDLLLQPGLARLRRASLQGLTLRYEDLRSNRVWTIDGGRLSLSRRGADFDIGADLAILGGGAQVATVSANYTGQIGALASQFGVQFADVDAIDVAAQGPAFGWLQVLRAPISGSLRGGVNEDASFAPLNATLQIGTGVIQPTAGSRAIPIEGARSYFTYNPAARQLRFDELSVDSQWINGGLNGTATVVDDGQGKIQDLIGQFRLTDLNVNPADLYDAPIQLDAAELDIRLTPDPFILKVGRLDVQDQGQLLNASGTLRADDMGWDIALDATLDGYGSERLMALWPAQVASKTRQWLKENLYRGTLRDVTAALRWSPGLEPEAFVGFAFEQADVQFLKTMPPVTAAQGHASLLRDRFVLVVDSGTVEAPQGGQIDVGGTSFIVPDVKAKEGTPGVVRLKAQSSVTAALALLDQPPLEVMRKAGLPVALAQGHADVSGTLALPLIKDAPVSSVTFDVVGQISDVVTDVLIKDRVLQVGTLDLVASETGVQLAGRGNLDGVPFDATWRQPLNEPGAPGQLTGRVDVTPQGLAALGISVPPGYVTGQTSADIDVTLVKGAPPKLNLRSDLRGLGLSIPAVGWAKAANTPAEFALSAILSEVAEVEDIRLRAPGLTAVGDISLSDAGTLDQIRLSRVQIADWLDASVDLIGRGAGVPLGVVLRGGTIDLRRADIPDGEGSGQSTPITLALDRLQVTDAIAITGLQGNFTSAAGLDGTFTGRINGGALVQGQLVPQAGRSALRLRASDAGAVFASANVMQQIRGGTLELVLRPVGTGGAFDGTLKVQDTSLVDAPAMAALLNAVSIVGLFNVEGSDSLFFSDVNADFRLAPNRITLRQGSAEGPSMGLSMDGIFATDTGALQMQGVITPIYLLNGIAGVLSRPGQGLIAFNYTLGGTVRDPDVFVNPLTALTPGVIRDLFRGPKPDVPLAEGETPPPEPEERQTRPFTRGEDR